MTSGSVSDSSGSTAPVARALRDVQEPNGGPTPRDWTDAITHLHAARVAKDVLRSPGATQVMIDEATVAYSRAVDALFGCMDRLMSAGVTGVIGAYLCKREKR